ncbi:MAG: hypothetical protein J5I94_27745, partial [Phaeodactylibacter sp.]|nr:hypothetical protein [Phaeodactylibacter sp.]
MPFSIATAYKLSAPLSDLAETGRLFGRSSFTLLFLLFFWPLFLFSQAHLFDARMLTPDDGLANLMATSIYKDKQGFIWVATAYGLNRYDGYNFKLFIREENSRQANAKIACIREDEAGRLWLFYVDGLHLRPAPGTVRALDIFDPATGQAVPFEALFAGNPSFKANEVYLPRVLDPKNRLWIHTNKGALFLRAQGRFKRIFQREGAFFPYITIDGEENIWLGRRDSLLAVDTSGKILEQLRLPGQLLGAWAGPDEEIWTATQDAESQQISLWRKPKNGPLSPFQLLRNGQPVGVQTGYPFLHRSQGGYWFVNVEDQLHLFDPQGKWLCNYSNLPEKEPNTAFFSFVEDGRKLWLASSSGVLRVGARNNPFQLIHRKEKILSDCRGITEDENGNIYFLNTYAYQWDVSAQKCRQLPGSWGAAHALLYTDSALWVGTYGVDPVGFQLSLRTGKKTDYAPFSPEKFLVMSLAATGRPKRFLAGLNKGVAYLDLSQQKLLPFGGYHSYSERDSLLEQSEVNYIHKNASGYWLATSRGVFLLDEEKGVIR